MKYITKIVKTITNILLVVVLMAIFLVLYGMFNLKILNKSYVNYFGYTFFEVISGSMAPTINVYDVVIVKIDNNVKENDVITFYDNDFITHRVIEYKNDDEIITKGDANNTNDKKISKNDIIGKVVKIIPGFGAIKLSIMDLKVLIGIFVTMILFSLAFSIEKGGKNEK